VNDHPIRLVLTDDLRRSRLTVFVRLLLAIPHFLWAGLMAIAIVVVVFANWFILLARGQTPLALHDFIAGYIRYVTRIEGYVYLAANPFPPFFLGDDGSPYPFDIEIAPPARQNRWVTGFRLFLLLPAAMLSSAFVGNFGATRVNWYSWGLVTGPAAFLIWWAALARGRAPRGLRDLVAWGLGYGAQTAGYALLLTDRYPYSGPDGHLPALGEDDAAPHPVALAVTDDLRRSRLTVFFRLLLALPHIVWLALWGVVAWLAAVANWIATLALGRSPRPLVRFLGAYVRYTAHVNAFFCLVGNPFPGFVGAPGSYPVDIELTLAERQRRWITGFRLVLALPAILLMVGMGSLLRLVALLAWFAALTRGRMPRGLRNVGAYVIGYQSQVYAYLFVLTDRYPDSTPMRLLRAP
jgi:uncharacterized protein DUF4389